MNDFFKNSRIELIGRFSGDFEFSHEVMGEKFYINYVECKRTSGVLDVLPVIVSERIFDVKEPCGGRKTYVLGQIKGVNYKEGDRYRLLVYVFAYSVSASGEIELMDDRNVVSLKGRILPHPVYRHTPKGKEITDIMLLVRTSAKKSSKIPCIAWGRVAYWLAHIESKDDINVELEGRFQSREYIKKMQDGTEVPRVSYEVSVDMAIISEDGGEIE